MCFLIDVLARPWSSVKNLGVLLTLFQATFLTFVKQHFSILELSLNYINVKRQIHALMTSRLDYCTALQSACPASVNKLLMIQNAAPSVPASS